MTHTRNRLAAMLHAALLALSFFLLPSAVAPAAAEVIPIVITNIVVQKIGPEAELEPLEEGLLYWRPADATTDAGLYYADGETPGGVAVCVGKADYHTLTNDLACNGHALKLNAHYSLRAEGDSCLLRYGTNIVLRVDGNREAGSTNSLIKATVLSADNDGLTIQANALASDGATIEVTTDLMAVESWTTATNAVVIDSTDVSTTWRITYLDEPFQFYRVYAGASTPHGTGITAERPFTAAAGLSIPEGQPLTMGTNTWTDLPALADYATTNALAGASNALSSRVTAIESDYATGATVSSVRADLTSLAWRTTTNETAIDANAAGIATLQGAVATNAGNIATNAAAIGALDGRVSALELPEFTRLWWNATILANDNNYVPTNFATRALEINAENTNGVLTCIIPADWAPDREVVVRLNFYQTAGATNRVYIGNSRVGLTTSAQYRRYEFVWDVALKSWIWHVWGLTQVVPTLDGYAPAGYPSTVEEWEAARANTVRGMIVSTPSLLHGVRPSFGNVAFAATPTAPDPDGAPAAFAPGDFTGDSSALEDLAPEDFIDEDFTDPDPEDDALPTLDKEA